MTLPFAPTVMTCALAAVFLPGVLMAAEQTVVSGQIVSELRLREVGRDGQNADWVPIGSNDESTAGAPGGDVTATNHGTITTSRPTLREAVLLRSQGGAGGKGDGLLSASRGGDAGRVRMSNDGTIREELPVTGSAGPTSLIRLSSRGGDGGSAQLSPFSNGRLPPATGGKGGEVSFSTSTSIQATSATSVIEVESRGGNSGGGGYTSIGQTRPARASQVQAGTRISRLAPRPPFL
ncbi:hypothetical protein IMZ29_17070 [Achromobacter sp. GG226]|uniref:hypothetical protein n=1 Tax=Verticiella alkaliphila TaxID=2779529 RepID=UPI001C0B0958|nr:hypothetical protein [Verticiella sp. GG226]MBU4612191.1 hypothetical protein [Verticiella sp. GG226]